MKHVFFLVPSCGMCEQLFEMSKVINEHLSHDCVDQLKYAPRIEGERYEEGLKSHPTCPFGGKSCAGTSSNGSNEADWLTARFGADPI